MKKHIYDEKNGLSYTLHGDYYLPDFVINEDEPTYGKYGMMRKQFLKEHRSARYQYLLMTGKLTEHLNAVDQEVYWSSFLVTLCSEIMLYIETPLVSYSYSLNEVSHSCTS